MAFLGQEEQIREFQDRFKFLYAALFVAIGLLTIKLTYLQILKGDEMRLKAEENRIKRVKIAAPRGMIFDRNRTLLIDNQPAFDLEVIPQYLKESKETKSVVALLSKIIKTPEVKIYDILEKAKNQASYVPVKIKKDLTRDEVAEIKSWQIAMPGVQVEMEIKRTNVYKDIASHLLGYIGEVNNSELDQVNKDLIKNNRKNLYKAGDSIGKFGLEQKTEQELRGIDGEELVEVDALGRRKREQGRGRTVAVEQGKQAIPGRNLILTIDQDLQLAATKAFGDKIGAVVAIDPNTGQILTMLSRPSFDPTEFSRAIPPAVWMGLLNNENRPLRDKTLQDHYSPGSVFKTVTAIAALQEGAINKDTRLGCSGSMRLGNRVYHCWKKQGHGEVNVVNALIQSCDIFFYRTAQKLKSVDDIAKWAFHLGLGRRTGINLSREVPGLIPTEEWKMKRFHEAWSGGETLSVAIGQSYVLTTVLQLANLYASIANGGTLYRPYLIQQIESYEGKVLKQFQPEPLDQTRLSPETYRLIREGLWGVVNTPHGTAYSQRLPGMDVVGKTGTVQVMSVAADKIYQKCENMKFRQRHHGLFAGFAPANDPKIAVAVITEHSCHGATASAPIARAVIKTYLEKYFPERYSEKVLAAKLKQKGESTYVPKAPSAVDEDEGVTEGVINHNLEESDTSPPPAPPRLLPAPGTPSGPSSKQRQEGD